LRIVVCVKQISGRAGLRNGSREEALARHFPNPLDLVAIEQARRLVARHGGHVSAVTVGSSRAEAVLRKALMMGVDRAVRVWSEELAAADSFAVATALAATSWRIGFDLLLCGARSADSGAEVVGALLADLLGVPLITRAVGLELDTEAGRIVAHKKVEKGGRETYTTIPPAVVTVEEGAAEPRYCDPRWLDRGLHRAVETLSAEQLGLASSPPYHPRLEVLEVTPPRPRTKVGIRVAGLSLKDKLAVMRGQAGRSPGVRLFDGAPHESARRIKEHVERWLG